MAIIVDDDVHDENLHLFATDGTRITTTLTTLFLLLDALPMMAAPLCIRFASNASIQQLNSTWRHKDTVTDVLSFPMQDGPEFEPDQPLGDIVLAVPFIKNEAKRLALPVEDHTLHLIVHAVLHLLGYDHKHDQEAASMQRIEAKCLHQLGLHNPYPSHV